MIRESQGLLTTMTMRCSNSKLSWTKTRWPTSESSFVNILCIAQLNAKVNIVFCSTALEKKGERVSVLTCP